MTDAPQGDGWRQASDRKWYPPDKRPGYGESLPPPPAPDAAQQRPADSTPIFEQPEKPATTRQVIPRDKLGELSKIGQGGQGVVYRAPNVKTRFAASMVFKEYKPAARADIDFTALAAMPALVEESLTYAQAERLISFAAWPCALIDDAGTPTGFVMPAIPDEFFIALTTVKGVSSATAEFQHLLNHASVLAARDIEIDDAQSYLLLREVASALAFLHKQGVCVGDISPKNLLFSLTPQEAVYFIDCDAMCIDTVSALPQVETPGWKAPSGEELATTYTDTYKLGLLALRLLSGDQDTSNPQHLPPATPALLRQIITDTLTKPPHQRPLPEAWTAVLGNAIEHAQQRQKAPTAVSAASAPPTAPIVRCRPTPHSAPPVRPSMPPVPQPRPAEGPPTEIGTPPPPLEQRPRRRRKWPLITAAIIVILAAASIAGYLFWPSGCGSKCVALPFTGLSGATGVAVDGAGNVYVTDYQNRVLKLPAGASTPAVLPFDGLGFPEGVVANGAGDLYVADRRNNRVVKLAAGSSTQAVLPFTDLWDIRDVAVDGAGNVYVTDDGYKRVVELLAGSNTQAVLPFTGLNSPRGVAVDAASNVYVTDYENDQVVKLAVDSAAQTVLPFTGLRAPNGVVVDAVGDVYVADSGNGRVVKLAPNSSTQTVLPFAHLNAPYGVALDTAGNIYVAEFINSRVVKLPAQ